MKFDNSFARLPEHLFERVIPTPLQNAKLALWNSTLAKEINLTVLPTDEILSWLKGEIRIPGDQQISTRYAGHQFGHWAGQLGDGRAISLGELLTNSGRQEIQTKGSGLTPFSRMGDGKAVIRSSVREFFCSEAMHGLNIPTTRALALFTGTDLVERETRERSALVARVFPSNLRFGHFEYCYHYQRAQELQALTEYTLQTFFPGKTLPEMLETVVRESAALVAHWMSVGFCHGVMNTDNMSVLSLTLDYGPFGFLDDFEWHHICNHSDDQGRYAFDHQPQIMFWNLNRFFQCFTPQLNAEDLGQILQQFGPYFQSEWDRHLCEKLGLETFDAELTKSLFQILAEERIDYTFFFRQLCHFTSDPSIFHPISASDKLKQWLKQYTEKRVDGKRFSMLKKNPKFVLRNWIADEIIREVEADSLDRLPQWLQLFQHPFDEHPGFEKYALPPASEQKHFAVSCSS